MYRRQRHCFASDDDSDDSEVRTESDTNDRLQDAYRNALKMADDDVERCREALFAGVDCEARQRKARNATKQRVIVNRYRIDLKLGSGSFGIVHRVQDTRDDNTWKALKMISVCDLSPDETLDAVKEARLQAKLDHPGIVHFHDCFVHANNVCIVTEYCEGGDLHGAVTNCRKRKEHFPNTVVLDWFVQLLQAIKYLHSRKIIHRDLKSRNILLKENRVKICDFGISKMLTGTTDIATTFTGTPHYMSPEILKHEGYSLKSDIWSLGVILYELCTLRRPFEGMNVMKVMMDIANGSTPSLPVSRGPDLISVYDRMLCRDVNGRPSARELLQLPFLRSLVDGKKESKSQNIKRDRTCSAKSSSTRHTQSLRRETSADPRPMTPRERLASRKQERAMEEAKRIKQLTAQSYEESRRRLSVTRDKQAKISVFPWLDTSSQAEIVSATQDTTAEDRITDADEVTETYYLQSDFEEGSSSSDDVDTCDSKSNYSASSDNDSQALQQCMMEALDATAMSTQTYTDDEGTTLYNRKIHNLRRDCQRLLGDQFQLVYDFLNAVRFNTKETVNEQVIMSRLKEMVANPRDCFLVDQLLFLEKQEEISQQCQ